MSFRYCKSEPCLFIAAVPYNKWTWASILGSDPDDVWSEDVRDGQDLSGLMLVAIVTVSGICFPIRAYRMWFIPLCGWFFYTVLLRQLALHSGVE